jgi:hypothetical protein
MMMMDVWQNKQDAAQSEAPPCPQKIRDRKKTTTTTREHIIPKLDCWWVGGLGWVGFLLASCT